jgi:hypothetical protein
MRVSRVPASPRIRLTRDVIGGIYSYGNAAPEIAGCLRSRLGVRCRPVAAVATAATIARAA